jgi:hypothetical protein
VVFPRRSHADVAMWSSVTGTSPREPKPADPLVGTRGSCGDSRQQRPSALRPCSVSMGLPTGEIDLILEAHELAVRAKWRRSAAPLRRSVILQGSSASAPIQEGPRLACGEPAACASLRSAQYVQGLHA